MRRAACSGLLGLGLVMVSAGVAEARLTKLVVINTVSPTFEGRTFKSGQYELVTARAYGELDPRRWENAGIVNLAKALRNDRGNVEYSVDVQILKPIDLTKGSRTLFYDVVNRGNKRVLGSFNSGSGGNSATRATDAGNGFLMDLGYSVVWSAWQGDVEGGDGRIIANFPVAMNDDGSPIVGQSREEFTDTGTGATFAGALVYPAAHRSGATLTVRQNEGDPRQTPPGLAFTWTSDNQIRITRPPGFDSGALYEFIYSARDPIVMGIGFAATRDVVSFLRNDSRDDVGTANPLSIDGRPNIRTTLAFGSSQSGRFLRDFLYQGFNRDERHRRVIDGMIPHIAGSRKTFTNYEFAQPGRYSRQHEDHLYPGDQFPFTYGLTYDPISRRIDGIMLRCRLTNTCPKVMHTDSETEIWQARGSLVVMSPSGHPIHLPPDVRAYSLMGTQHGPAATPSRGICKNLSNPLPHAPAHRALLSALDAWVKEGVRPPPTNYPTLHEGELAPPEVIGWPGIPGVTFTGMINQLPLKLLISEPPTTGRLYSIYANIVDADGNGIAGVHHPFLTVPIGTHTGWNLRSAGNAENEGCSTTGSYIPFARTKAERDLTGDPRLSLEERYPTHAAYVAAVERAARQAVTDRLLLQFDADAIVRDADGRAVP